MLEGRIHEAESRVESAISGVMKVARQLLDQRKQMAERVVELERHHAAYIDSTR